MRRNPVVFEPVSTPLETPINVPFKLVGYQQWFDNDFEPSAVLDEEKIIISDPEQQLQPIIQQVRRMRLIGVDTETTGPYHSEDQRYALNPINEDCRIVLLQLGNEEQVWIIQPALIPYFKEVLESTDQLHLAHNWAYDFKWLLVKNNIHPRRLYCSMLAEQLLTAGLLGYKVNLADCARRYEPHYLVSKAVRSMFPLLGDGKMTRKMVKYAVRDIPLLFPVFRAQVKELIDQDLTFVAQLEFDNIPVAAEMETGGIYLDEKKLHWLITYWERRKEEMEEEILTKYSKRRKEMGQTAYIIPDWPEVFDLGSNKSKRDALKKIGVSLDEVQRDTLLASGDEIAKLLAEYSHALKMTSTYGGNMLKKINKFTGRFHPRFYQMGQGSAEEGRDTKETTATGRWAGNAQQFPRESDGIYAAPLDEADRKALMAEFAKEIAAADAEYKQ